ncbi:MAG: acetate kinase [Pseudomonadota bacterium]
MPGKTGWILAVNAGSSSLKLSGFGAGGVHVFARTLADTSVADLSRKTLAGIIQCEAYGAGCAPAPCSVGHRIVHGGPLSAPAELTPEVMADVEAAAAFAPLHNPPALHMVGLMRALFPDARQFGCFDTAFHARNPVEAVTLPIPAELREAGLRRYGFHGLSYASTLRRFEEVTGSTLPDRLLIAHLGAGASLAAVKAGRGVATTMGFSPMDGLVMATRAGALDPGVIFHLVRAGHTPDEVETLLNKESGLLALGGSPSMKELTDRTDAEARAAVTQFCYWVTRHAGSMIAAMGGIDGMVFTGGIGENAKGIRADVTGRLAWTGLTADRVWVVPADEEGEIARSVRDLLTA